MVVLASQLGDLSELGGLGVDSESLSLVLLLLLLSKAFRLRRRLSLSSGYATSLVGGDVVGIWGVVALLLLVTMVTVGVAWVAGEGEVVRIGTGMSLVLVLESGGSGEDSGLEWWSKMLSLSSSSNEVFCDDLVEVGLAPSSLSWSVVTFLLSASMRRSMAVNSCWISLPAPCEHRCIHVRK